MRSLRMPTLALVVFAAAAAGCSARTLRPEAFRRAPAVAVVGVYTQPKVFLVTHSVGVGPFGQTETRDHGEEIGGSAAVFGETKRAALRVLASSKRLRLLPEDAVLGSATYAAARSSETNVFTARLVPARGYKKLYDAERMAAVARAMRVDGAMTVSIDHAAVPDGGGVAARVVLGIGTADRAGQWMWNDYVVVRSDRKLPAGAKLDLNTLRPLLVEATEKGTRALLQKLDEQLRGW